jgi:GT2 family glycosyltransferase
MKIAIFTLCKDRLAYTKLTFQSLKEKTHIPYDHFIIDQESTDGTVEWLKEMTNELGKSFVYALPKNIGINRGINFALDRISKEYDVIVKLDNDALIETDGWLEKCLEVLTPKLIISPYVMGLIQNRGGIPRYAFDKERKLGFTFAVGGICQIGLSRAWFEDSGGFDYPVSQYVPDSDISFCKRLTQVGYRFAYKEDVIIHHIDTTAGQLLKYKDLLHIVSYQGRTLHH